MPARIPFRFSGSNPHAQRVAARQAAALVTRITAETMHALRTLITQAIREGIPPYDAARMIRSMVGLTAQQAQAAANYRAELINQGLSIDRVNALTDRYSEKLLRVRAESIARTEIMDALNEGAQESMRQAQQEGLLGESAKKEWLVTPDDLLCPICAPMEGKQVPIDEDFPVEGPPAHPNCRCTVAPVP